MQTIPEQIRKLALSPELYDQSEKVGEKFNLHINQVGELDAEIRDVLQGFSKPADFTQHIMERLEVSSAVAKQITDEVNSKIFNSIREQLQKTDTAVTYGDANLIIGNSQDYKVRQETNAVEQAGGFIIEPESSQNQEEPNVSLADKDKILNDIENPTPGHEEVFTEPLVDQLLTGATTTIEKKIAATVPSNLPVGDPVIFEKTGVIKEPSQKPATPEKPPEPAQKPKGPDPYRELIK